MGRMQDVFGELLLVMQGLNRVDPAGPLRGDEGCTGGDHREGNQGDDHCGEVGGNDTEELRRDISSEQVRAGDSNCESRSE